MSTVWRGNVGSAQEGLAWPDIMMKELNTTKQFQFGNDKAYLTLKPDKIFKHPTVTNK